MASKDWLNLKCMITMVIGWTYATPSVLLEGYSVKKRQMEKKEESVLKKDKRENVNNKLICEIKA